MRISWVNCSTINSLLHHHCVQMCWKCPRNSVSHNTRNDILAPNEFSSCHSVFGGLVHCAPIPTENFCTIQFTAMKKSMDTHLKSGARFWCRQARTRVSDSPRIENGAPSAQLLKVLSAASVSPHILCTKCHS